MQGALRHAKVPQRGDTVWHAWEVFPGSVVELRDQVTALHFHAPPVPKISPVAGTATSVDHRALDMVGPSFDAEPVELVHVFNGAEKVGVLGSACPLGCPHIAIRHQASGLRRSADMSAGVYRVTAERAYGTSGVYYLTCALGERAGGAYRHPYQQHFGYFIAVLIKGFAVVTSVDIGDGVSLYDHMRRRRIPT